MAPGYTFDAVVELVQRMKSGCELSMTECKAAQSRGEEDFNELDTAVTVHSIHLKNYSEILASLESLRYEWDEFLIKISKYKGEFNL